MIVKCKILLIVLLCRSLFGVAQETEKDSLHTVINDHKREISGVNALVNLSLLYRDKPDTMFLYADEGLAVARSINYRRGEADCLWLIASSGSSEGDYKKAIKYSFEARNVYESIKDNVGVVESNLLLQGNYREFGDYRSAVTYAFAGAKLAEANNVKGRFTFFPTTRLAPLLLAEVAQSYVLMNQLDSAIFYTQKAIDMKELFNGYDWNFPIYLLATYQTMKGDYTTALRNYHLSKSLSSLNGFERDVSQNMSGMSTLFLKTGQIDSVIYYAKRVINEWTGESEVKNLIESATNLAQAYKRRGNADSALKYSELNYKIKDSVFNRERDRELQRLAFNEELKQQEIITAQTKYKSRVQLYSLSGGLFILLLIAFLLWRNNRQKQKAKSSIERAYDNLKSTQQQLIQSEKMASLGELTAGIAHEIQNPLNFVNNFSEVNVELVDELKSELTLGNTQSAFEIAEDIKENEQKINLHGKRADAIVKSMLQHSRISSGQKELTDINALTDEYLRLAWHGIRAKDKNFNAEIRTDFDNSVGRINIVRQEIGRVILNLVNNAFYAVNEKKKLRATGYEPLVIISTKKLNDRVEIRVKDNGTGISQKILEKIFQPFFTTKPTGQGTGLGLYLAYDIIKAHGGEIKVETKEGEGSEFIVQLPATSGIV